MLSPPPRDQHGAVLPHDHNEIYDEDELVRHLTIHHLAPTKGGGKRVSSAFLSRSSQRADPYEGYSVELLRLLIEDGIDLSGRYCRGGKIGGAAISAGCLRAESTPETVVKVGYAPEPENAYHCAAWGIDFDRPNARRYRVLQAMRWLVLHSDHQDVVLAPAS